MKEIKIEVPDGYEIDKENSTFETIKFKEKSKLPMSWKELEYLKGYYINSSSQIQPYTSKETDNDNKNTWPTKELAEAALALSQLLQLRDRWNGDWKPSQDKHYSIAQGSDVLKVYAEYMGLSILSFKDDKTADLFFETFIDLIETAKPLL